MRGWLACGLLLAVAQAGCFGGDDAAAPTSTDGPSVTGTMTSSDSTPGVARVDAPQWTVGQAWTWRLDGSALAEPREGTSVVLAAEGTTYDVGATDVLGGAAVYPFHVVALGAVAANCLCWEAHGSAVELLRFPLADGDQFTTDFWSAPGAQVVVNATNVTGPDGPLPGFRSVASFAGGGVLLVADYAPSLGQFVRVATYFGAEEPFVEAVLVAVQDGAAGVGFRATELARYTASAADAASLAPHPITIPAGSEVVMLACFLPGAAGLYFAELSTAGVPLACGGGSGDSTTYAGTHTEAMAGPGSVTAAPGGQGGINIEVFAVDTTAPG